MLETANAWVPGAESVAEATWDAWLAQEEGRVRDEAGLILYDARLAPPDTDLADHDSLESSLRWVYGDCDWKRGSDGEVDVRAIIKRVWSLKSRTSESKRKYLNWPSVHEDAWCDPTDWKALAAPDRVVDPTEPVALFFDGSKSRDATALIGCCISDGHVFVPRTIDGRPTVWEPDPSHDTEDVVPVVDVDLAVKHVGLEALHVVGFFGDVQEWESFVKIDWPKAFGERLQVMAVPGGKDPQRIAWDMRSNLFDFTRAAELAEAEIREGQFTHDDDPILARHVANMRRRPNRYGVSVGKESPSSPLKIDAGVCMIGVRMVRRLVLAGAPKTKRTGRVW
jgi:hypothetical protein